MKKKNKESNTLEFCMKYASNCSYCPRNKKCDEELARDNKATESLKNYNLKKKK